MDGCVFFSRVGSRSGQSQPKAVLYKSLEENIGFETLSVNDILYFKEKMTILYSEYNMKIGRDLLDIQYLQMSQRH